MAALLLSLIACLLVSVGGRSQILAASLGARFQRRAPLIAGLIVTALCLASLSAAAGIIIHRLLEPAPRQFFLALALAFTAITMLMPPRPVSDMKASGSWLFPAAIGTLLMIGIGDRAPFLLTAIVVRYGDPYWAAIGGFIGTATGLVASALFWQEYRRAIPPLINASRILSVVLLVCAFLLGIEALGLTA